MRILFVFFFSGSFLFSSQFRTPVSLHNDIEKCSVKMFIHSSEVMLVF